jgi:hypothetical protein
MLKTVYKCLQVFTSGNKSLQMHIDAIDFGLIINYLMIKKVRIFTSYMPFMRPYIFVTIFIILTLQAFSQNETSCIKRIKEFSVGMNFPTFSGLTVVSKDTIKFDSSMIIIHDTDPEIKKIFEVGLVFPDLIYGASTTGDKFEFNSTFSADTLSISNVSELHFQNQKADTKCFSFLLWHKMMANPSLYIFELTSDPANSKTTMKAFIEKAKVTAFGFCSILI